MADGTTTLLLPGRARFGGQRLGPVSAAWLGRGDRSQLDAPGPARHFSIPEATWPVAAATRQQDAGDAGEGLWLRADPVHVRPDMNGVRLLSHGDALLLEASEAALFAEALRPVFEDAGLSLDAPVPTRWYLRLANGSGLPPMTPIDEALGDDLFEHLPAGSDGRRWRALLSEAQVILHNHPRNAERAAAGLATINSVWFWGGGTLPERAGCRHARVLSDDSGLRAMAALAGSIDEPLPASWQGGGPALVDLRRARDLAVLERDWLAPLLGGLGRNGIRRVELEFADGLQITLAPWQRLRLWRAPLRSFVADPVARGDSRG